MSAPFKPAAWTRTSTWPDPGSGSGCSSTKSSPSRTVTAFTRLIFPRSAKKGVRVRLLTGSQVRDRLYVSGASRHGKASIGTPPNEPPPPLCAAHVAGKPDRVRARGLDALRCVARRRRRRWERSAGDADLRAVRRGPLHELHGALAQADRPSSLSCR